MITNKPYTKITLLVLLFMGWAYSQQYVHADIRLAGMGGLDLVVETWDNEINAFDFGESPAGAIEDNDGVSTLYIPGAYGLAVIDEPSADEYSKYSVSLQGIAKMRNRFAVGNSISKKHSSGTYYLTNPGFEPEQSSIRINYLYDTLCVAHNTTEWLSLGLRGSYYKYSWFSESDLDTASFENDRYNYEPALLFRYAKKWQIGLQYRLSKHADITMHRFKMPIILTTPVLQLGIRADVGPLPNQDDWEKSIHLRSLYRMPVNTGSLNFGLLLAYSNPRVSDDFITSSRGGWLLDYGTGIAFTREMSFLIGLQYKGNIIGDSWAGETYTTHVHQLAIGAEIFVWKCIPVRLGYVFNRFDDPYYDHESTYHSVTSGLGVRIPSTEFELDITYSPQFSGDENAYVEGAHVFGLSGRLIF